MRNGYWGISGDNGGWVEKTGFGKGEGGRGEGATLYSYIYNTGSKYASTM